MSYRFIIFIQKHNKNNSTQVPKGSTKHKTLLNQWIEVKNYLLQNYKKLKIPKPTRSFIFTRRDTLNSE